MTIAVIQMSTGTAASGQYVAGSFGKTVLERKKHRRCRQACTHEAMTAYR